MRTPRLLRSPRVSIHAALIAALASIGGGGCVHSAAERRAAALPSVTALQAGEFDKAEQAAAKVLEADGGNSQAAAVAAITLFKRSMHQLVQDVIGAGTMLGRGGVMDHRYVRFALQTAVEELDRVDHALAAAATDGDFSLELCMACWKVDWNRNGRIDERDERFFQIEIDAEGNEYPPDDPRRKPTFRLDAGDVHWARALVGFQRAVLELLLSYDWSGLQAETLRPVIQGEQPLRVPVGDKAKFARVSQLLRFALDEADACRRAYLAETDDDREWVPNPAQRSHPLPLPVDAALYDTWAGVLSDLRAILDRKEGISVAELAQLGRDHWDKPPGGFLDLGGLLGEPRDIVFDWSVTKGHNDDKAESIEAVLSSWLGDRYVKSMTATKLISRLQRMKSEVDHGSESFERKLRYLFWLN